MIELFKMNYNNYTLKITQFFILFCSLHFITRNLNSDPINIYSPIYKKVILIKKNSTDIVYI